MAYVPPQSLPSYDIYHNDYMNWNYAPPAGNFAWGAPAGTPRYGLQPRNGGAPVPVPSMRTPAQAPAFQVPAPVERTLSTGSSAALSSSPQTTPSGESSRFYAPSPERLAQLSTIPAVNLPASANVPLPGPSRRRPKRVGPPRRRGPNKRHAGSGYVDMMNGLPEEVQNALRKEYEECCEVVKGKDPSTVQKHRFTRRHFNKIDPKLQRLLPAFTCPAFVGLHDKCKSAKAGRYDSTERHCNNCPGFKELRAKSHVDTLYPFAISKEEFDALQKFRKTLKFGKKVDAPALIQTVIYRLVTTLTGAPCLPDSGASSSPQTQPADVPGPAGASAAPTEESSSPSPPPMDPSPSAQPQQQQPELLFPAEAMHDFAGNDRAVAQQAAAAAAWLDAFGNAQAFAQGPNLGPQAQYGLYPEGPSTWPNMDYDPATFGPFFG